MSETLLINLRDYLIGTLTPSNMNWLGQQLIRFSHRGTETTSYTKQELLERAENGRKQISDGEFYTTEEVFSILEQQDKQLELA